jgi:PIN domain nuclease of toxin-antitoxin system
VRALLDTRTLLWWILDDPTLTRRAETVIADTGNSIVVSAASAWELSIKFGLGRIPGASDLITNFSDEMENEGFQLLPISVEHGIRAGLLPGLHKDPFDRMLAAQDQAENIPIISNEAVFEGYGVRRLW